MAESRAGGTVKITAVLRSHAALESRRLNHRVTLSATFPSRPDAHGEGNVRLGVHAATS